jgi:hypothetical protein
MKKVTISSLNYALGINKHLNNISGELFDKIIEKGSFSEKEAAYIMR